MYEMEIPFSTTKLVIRLSRSIYGTAFFKTKGPFFDHAGPDGFRVDIPEMTPEDIENTDMAITLFIKERLIPVAERTCALVVAYDSLASYSTRGGGSGADCRQAELRRARSRLYRRRFLPVNTRCN